MLDLEVTTEVADAIAEIGRVDPRYHSPEGVLFRKALALIANEKDWWCGAESRGASNSKCLIQAIYKANGCRTDYLYGKTRDSITHFCGVHPVTFNDSHVHAEVISMLTSCGRANGWL